MLAQLRRFAKSDITPGGQQREDDLVRMIDIFEEAALREFELWVHSTAIFQTRGLLDVVDCKQKISTVKHVITLRFSLHSTVARRLSTSLCARIPCLSPEQISEIQRPVFRELSIHF